MCWRERRGEDVLEPQMEVPRYDPNDQSVPISRLKDVVTVSDSKALEGRICFDASCT